MVFVLDSPLVDVVELEKDSPPEDHSLMFVFQPWCLASFDGVEQDKVDVVKMTMQDNIQQMLVNEERLDQISQNAENLNEQVGVKTSV